MPLDELMWVEKYRPHKLEDLVNQESVKERLAPLIEKPNELPHLLFSGPPGTGKTTAATIIARSLLHDLWEDYSLSLNASDERGIDMVRERVKIFASYSDRSEGIPFRLVILDEADEMTTAAQTALRRIMEESSKFTRFILICVAPSTKVLLPEEVEISVADLMNRKEKSVSGVDLRTATIKDDRVVAYLESSPEALGKSCLRIVTNTGRELELTEDHPVWTANGWAPARTLRIGERVAVFPHLEGTNKDGSGPILETGEFFDSIETTEITLLGCKKLGQASSFASLTTRSKKQIAEEVIQLWNTFIKSDRGITAKEQDILRTIASSTTFSRLEIQEHLGLSRIRANQLLLQMERKGHVNRVLPSRPKQLQLFRRADTEMRRVRNLADIRRLILEKYSLQVSYSKIHQIVAGSRLSGRAARVTDGLIKRKLLPLTYGAERLGAIARLTGFLFGDGCLASQGGRVIFTGNEGVLEEVKRDVHVLGFKASKISSKCITSEIGHRKFTGITKSFFVDSIDLWSLFCALGVPVGDKADQSYELPSWISHGTRFAKREFLRGFFDCESCTPRIEKRNFEALWLTQNKTEPYLGSGKAFMQQVTSLLNDFDVDTVPLRVGTDGTRKDGTRTYKIGLILSSSNSNLRGFFSQVGFAYDRRKRLLARLGHEYLRYKSHRLAVRQVLAQKVHVALNNNSNGSTVTEIAEEFGSRYDFVKSVQMGKQVKVPRKGLLTFEEWVSEYSIPGTELVWNEIEVLEERKLSSVVDITTKNFHTFLSNGLLSHNCNYSSGIIDPIQSRCAIFRFQRIDEVGVVKCLARIAKNEKVKISGEGVLETIFEATNGDLRQAINHFQAASAGGEVTAEKVRLVTGATVRGRVSEIVTLAMGGDFNGARLKLVELTRVYGVPESDFLKYANEEIVRSKTVKISQAMKIIAEYDYRLIVGANPEIQLSAMLAELSALGRGENPG